MQQTSLTPSLRMDQNEEKTATPRAKTLRFSKLEQDLQIQEFLSWLPQEVQAAPHIDWATLPYSVMRYLACTVGDSPDAPYLAIAGAVLHRAINDYGAGKMVGALHRLLQLFRESCGMTRVAELSDEHIWNAFASNPAFEGKRWEVLKTYASVSGGHLPAFLQRLTVEERQWFQPYMLPLMPHGFAKHHDGRAKHTAASKKKRKEKSDILVPLYPVLRQVVRARKQLAERTFQAIREAHQCVEEGCATLPFSFQHTDLIPFVNRDARTVAEAELHGREVTMYLTLWDKRSWVLHHPARFSESTCFAAKAGRDAYDQEHNGFFVQFNGPPSDLLWFGDLIEQRILQQFNRHNATTDEYQRRWQFARSFGFSNGCTCSRPSLLSPSDYWYSDGASSGDMLFEPEALYRGILYGAALATIALSNGSRVSELLQVSLDRRITQTEMVRVLDESGLPVLGEDGHPLTKQVKMHLQYLLPKGSRTEEERQLFPLSREALRLLGEIKKGLDEKHGAVPCVAPSKTSAKYEHLKPERYFFQCEASPDGKVGIISLNDVQILLRFVLHGLDLYTAQGERIHVSVHLLRHVMATSARHYQHVPAEAIAHFFLHHRFKTMHESSFTSVVSDYYWQMTEAQRLALIRDYLDEQEEHDRALVLTPPTPRDLEQMNEDLRRVYEHWHTLHPTAFGNCGCPGLCPRGMDRALCLGCSYHVEDPAKLGSALAWRTSYEQQAASLEAQGNLIDARQARIKVQLLDDMIAVMRMQLQEEAAGRYIPVFKVLPSPYRSRAENNEEES